MANVTLVVCVGEEQMVGWGKLMLMPVISMSEAQDLGLHVHISGTGLQV